MCSTMVCCWTTQPALAQVSPTEPQPTQADAQNGTATNNANGVNAEAAPAAGDIVVTASRRSQVLQDIPYNITAVGGADLAKSGTTSLNSLAQVIPGLQNVDTGPSARGGNSNFSMRGLRTDAPGAGVANFRSGSVASVSTYLGETPIFFPLMLKDLDRVEVLKGPQGTLYGSGALAGTIRLIPKRPSFTKFTAEINAQGSLTEHSGQANHAADATINIPLSSNLALRMNGGYEHLGGFIDSVGLLVRQGDGGPTQAPALRVPGDPNSGYITAPIKRDTNSSLQWFARAAVRWQVTPSIDAELSYIHQHTKVDDAQLSNPNYKGGTYNFAPDNADPNSINTYQPGGKYRSTADNLSPNESDLDLGNLLVSADLGFATVTSSTSAYRTKSKDDTYYTPSTQIFNPDGTIATNFAIYYSNFPRFNYYNVVRSREKSLIEELRLVSNGTGPFSYVVGAYYQAQDYNFSSRTLTPGYSAYLSSVGVPQNNADQGDTTYLYPFSTNGFRFRDKAVFGELTYHITPKWQVTGGVRFFWQSFTSLGQAFAVNGGAAFSIDGVDATGLSLDVNNVSKVNDHIVKINSSYDFSESLKLYATYSEGFRRGGANSINSSGGYASLPVYQNFEPDVAKNYELGVKGAAFDRRLRFSADIFLIDLSNFQFSNINPSGFPVVFNGTNARSKGFEADVDARVSRALTIRASYTYTDSKVRQGFTYLDYSPGTLLISPGAPDLVPSQTVPSGARLPQVPKHTITVGADYSIPLAGASALALHADASYKSSAAGTIDRSSVFYWTIPSSVIANARLTYDTGGALSADIFVNNLTNDTAYSGATGPQTVATTFSGRYVTRPRTYGVGIHYRF